MRVGLVGCGAICRAYLDNADTLEHVEFVACTDLDVRRAEEIAAQYGLELGDAGVELTLCLTPPDAHTTVLRQAIAQGRHVYTEKPLATRREDARAILAEARARDVRVGCAPDTFLGGGIQTLRSALPRIGAPAVAHIRMLASPPERWHPSPAFLYADLAGPLLETFRISEPTRVVAVLAHDDGVLTTLTTSFDADGPAVHGIEIHGSEGTLLGGDPNGFDGPVTLLRHHERDEPIPIGEHHRTDNARGIGLEDLCRAIETGSPQRASGERGAHVLETLLAIRDSAREGVAVRIG